MKMKFRIIRYYDRYRAQVFDRDWIKWRDIGSPTGYSDVEDAKNYCNTYKCEEKAKIVEEFEL